jgi:Multiubiquitin
MSAQAQTKKFVTIIVEATEHQWSKDEITYAEVVTLEVPDYPQHPERVYSVTYEKAHGNKQGILSPGGSVKVKEGMVFFVKDTGES